LDRIMEQSAIRLARQECLIPITEHFQSKLKRVSSDNEEHHSAPLWWRCCDVGASAQVLKLTLLIYRTLASASSRHRYRIDFPPHQITRMTTAIGSRTRHLVSARRTSCFRRTRQMSRASHRSSSRQTFDEFSRRPSRRAAVRRRYMPDLRLPSAVTRPG